MKLFQVKSLSAAYEKNIVLKNVSLKINQGEFIGIIGPNGAGKSTFLKLISGYLKPKKGEIKFLNKSIIDYSKKDLAKEMSIVHQSLKNIIAFTVREFVTTGIFPYKNFWEYENEKDKQLVDSALEITDSLHLQNRILTELSGGELQLVSIARALVQNKNILLLDEPISNLDLKHTVQIMDLLYKLNQSGATIITILHDINIAADYCSRIVALKNGKLFNDGPIDQVVTAENITKLYNINCSVKKNSITKKPNIILHPEFVK